MPAEKMMEQVWVFLRYFRGRSGRRWRRGWGRRRRVDVVKKPEKMLRTLRMLKRRRLAEEHRKSIGRVRTDAGETKPRNCAPRLIPGSAPDARRSAELKRRSGKPTEMQMWAVETIELKASGRRKVRQTAS